MAENESQLIADAEQEEKEDATNVRFLAFNRLVRALASTTNCTQDEAFEQALRLVQMKK